MKQGGVVEKTDSKAERERDRERWLYWRKLDRDTKWGWPRVEKNSKKQLIETYNASWGSLRGDIISTKWWDNNYHFDRGRRYVPIVAATRGTLSMMAEKTPITAGMGWDGMQIRDCSIVRLN